MKKERLLTLLFGLLIFVSCTDLEEDLGSSLTREQVEKLIDARQLVDANYVNLRGFATQDLVFALQEHSGDAVIGPTRGGDWDDNGVWRVLHQHRWEKDNPFILNTFNDLSGGVFQSIEALEYAEGEDRGEALFLQAWFVTHLNDIFGQVAFRDNLVDLSEPSMVLSGQEAVDIAIANLEEAIELLPETSDVSRVNKNTARAYLAKVLLNKAVYEKESRLPPFSFDTDDLNRIVQLTQDVNGYSIQPGVSYYDNFSPINDVASPEIIFSQRNVRGFPGGNVASRYFMTLHYNQNPGGWNGFTTIADFYEKFEDGDVRKGNVDYDGVTDVSGLKMGFLEGQQFDQNGNPVQDRIGNPLVFTVESPIVTSGSTLETSGVRGLKYAPDYQNVNSPNNDYVLLRYADVLLTQAEAQFRLGNNGEALAVINDLRMKRGASMLADLTEDDIIDERGRELWWEGHRRTDLIRFGKFLESWNEKDASDDYRVLFPIPERAVAINPNLTQNPGY